MPVPQVLMVPLLTSVLAPVVCRPKPPLPALMVPKFSLPGCVLAAAMTSLMVL